MHRVITLNPTSYVTCSHASTLDLNYSNDFSIQALIWKEPNKRSNQFADIFRKAAEGIGYSNSSKGWRIGFTYHAFYRTWSNFLDFSLCDGTNRVQASITSDPGWLYLTGTFDVTTKTAKIYCNERSVLATNAAMVPANIANTEPLLAGWNNLNNNIMLLRIWNRKLSDAEHTALFDAWVATRNPKLPTGFDATSLLSDLIMDTESNVSGAAGTGYVKDRVGSNHLQLVNGATLQIQTGSVSAVSPISGGDIGPSVYLKAGGAVEQHWFEIAESSNLVLNNRNSDWISHFGQWQPIMKPATDYWWRVKGRTGVTETDFTNIQHFSTRAAKTWYARPLATVGTYGTEDGSSYANAFNGLFAAGKIAINWTDSRGILWNNIEAGDTLYICGVHLPNKADVDSETNGHDYDVYILTDGYDENYPITIRGDYAPDPALIWGFHRPDTEHTWVGPDVNNVYSTVSATGWGAGLFESISGSTGTRMTRASGVTWVESGASWFFNTGDNKTYVKMSDDGSPVNKVWESGGWNLQINRRKHIKLQNIEIRGVNGFVDSINRNSEPAFPMSTYISWIGCTLRYGTRMIQPYYQNDYWKVDRCLLEHAASGIYGIAGQPDATYPGPDFMTVTNNVIQHIGTYDFPDIDGHAVGTQASDDWIVTDNVTIDTGSSIVFWTEGWGQSRNKILRNNVSNVTGAGDGIHIGGPSRTDIGFWVDNEVSDNIIRNCTNSGIGSTSNDVMKIHGNYLENTGLYGLWLAPVNGVGKFDLKDNSIINPTDYFLYLDWQITQPWTDFIEAYDSFGPDPEVGTKFYHRQHIYNLAQYKAATGFTTLQSWPPSEIAGSQSVITLTASSDRHITVSDCSRLSIKANDADAEVNIPILHGPDFMRVEQSHELILHTKKGNGIKEINLRNGGSVTVAIVGKAG